MKKNTCQTDKTLPVCSQHYLTLH